MTAIEKKIKRARTLLLLDQPFFGTLALRLPLVEDASKQTMCTDGKVIKYNPEFADGLTEEEIKGVLAHEVMHVANGHLWRRDDRDMQKWNAAADYAINDIIVGAGLTLPEGVLLDRQYTGMSAEQIYAVLPEDDSGGSGNTPGTSSPGGQESDGQATPGSGTAGQGKGQQPGDDPGGCGSFEDGPGTPADQKRLQNEWKGAVAQAAAAAKGRGHLPAALDRLVKELLFPEVPWAVLLRDLLQRCARNDYSWTQPNRRYLSAGVVLPALISDELPPIVLGIDTSGSITQELLDKFCAETSGILEAYNTTIHVVYCDARVQKTETLTRADLPLSMKTHGGGGTDFRPVFDWVEQNRIEPACVICLTDLLGSFPDKEPDYPVLWIKYGLGRRKAPFGQTTVIQ